jgi:hypothetical protein
MMNRREALQLLATAAALQLAPRKMMAAVREARAVLGDSPAVRTLNPHQQATVKEMVEMILPRTETPGAADVGVTEFIDLILTEWYDDPERARFLSGLADVDSRTRAMFGKDFVDCSSEQRAELMRDLGLKMVEEADPSQDWRAADSDSDTDNRETFYPMLRRLTLTAYYTSEAGATQALHFEIIPDRHEACVEIQGVKTERQ